MFRFAGLDTYIISKCPKGHRKYFLAGSCIVAFFALFSFFSLYQLMHFVSGNQIVILFLSFIFSMIFFNIYRFCFAESGWKRRSFNIGNPLESPSVFSSLLRILFIFLFILFLSKPLELWFFSFFSKDLLKASKIIESLISLHKNYPITWGLTCTTEFLFLLPLFIRYFSKRFGNAEYEGIKNDIHIRLIREEYSAFKETYTNILAAEHNIEAEFSEIYEDPPFNTVLKKRNPSKPRGSFINNSGLI